MKTTDKRVDTYIAHAADFAKPVLIHLRKVIHEAHPGIIETIKWGMPHFEYKGVICSMASFKAHCAFGFWKESLIPDMQKYIEDKKDAAMGSWGRIESVKDLPPDHLIKKWVQQAVRLNEEGKKVTKETKKKVPIKTPNYFLQALEKNKKAKEVFDNFSPSHKKEYVEWLVEAKTEETRQRRLETAIEWISQGKSRMWKYQK